MQYVREGEMSSAMDFLVCTGFLFWMTVGVFVCSWLLKLVFESIFDTATALQVYRKDGRGIVFCVLISPLEFCIQILEQIKARMGGYTTRLNEIDP
jgi:hypothetical protein